MTAGQQAAAGVEILSRLIFSNRTRCFITGRRGFITIKFPSLTMTLTSMLLKLGITYSLILLSLKNMKS
jgi:hypothetical protein